MIGYVHVVPCVSKSAGTHQRRESIDVWCLNIVRTEEVHRLCVCVCMCVCVCVCVRAQTFI